MRSALFAFLTLLLVALCAAVPLGAEGPQAVGNVERDSTTPLPIRFVKVKRDASHSDSGLASRQLDVESGLADVFQALGKITPPGIAQGEFDLGSEINKIIANI
ncbi:hypothetical protein JCM1840_002330 [Sporobolomyces johnsonii]